MSSQPRVHELNIEMLDAVAGGMKWQPGTKNDDVIDARGGLVRVAGVTFSLDINGKLTITW